MGLRRVIFLAAAVAASCVLVPAASGATAARPPLVWLKGEGNYTKSHRHPESIDKIVIHVTEGAFWGSVRWLQSPRALRPGARGARSRERARARACQSERESERAPEREREREREREKAHSVGIEHEGYTYGPGGFTDAQYQSSARLAAWIARRSLIPIDRKHIIGHASVPAPAVGSAAPRTTPIRGRTGTGAVTSGSCASTRASRS